MQYEWGENRNSDGLLVGKPEGKKKNKKAKKETGDNIKMDLREIG
jgi:hypothetical protein